MGIVWSVGIAWWSWKGFGRTAFDLRVWAPLALVTTARVALLLFIVFFHRPEIVAVGMPIVEWLGGPDATHYPDHLLLLARVFDGMDPVLLLLVGGITGVSTSRVLAARLSGTRPADFPLPSRAGFDGFIVALALFVIAVAVDRLFDFLPAALNDRGGKLGLALQMVRSGAMVLVLSPLVCAFGAIVVRGETAWAAMKRSTRIASAHPLVVLLITALPVFATMPFQVLAGPIGQARLTAAPEAMVLILAARILVELFIAHITLAAATRIALWNRHVDA